MELPRVTFIIANHNYGRYVCDAIDSALAQDYPKDKLTIFIVDDCSTDDSVKIIADRYFDGKTAPYQTKSIYGINTYFVTLKKSVGPSAARNVAIQNTIGKTDIFAILDADDINYPEKTMQLVNKIMEAPDAIGVAYADYDILNVETGNVIREFKQPYSQRKLLQECIVHSGAFINTKALLATQENGQYYDASMRTCEDYDLWIRISEKFMMVHVARPLSLVRNHKDNSTFTVPNETWKRNWQRIREKMAQRNG